MPLEKLKFERLTRFYVADVLDPNISPPLPPYIEPITPLPDVVNNLIDTYRGFQIFFSTGIGYHTTMDGKMVSRIDTAALMQLIDQWYENLPTVPDEPPPPPQVARANFKGINYVGSTWLYSDRPVSDLQLLKSLGLEWISLHVGQRWYEPIKGQFATNIEDNLLYVARAAQNAGLKVMLDNHTMAYTAVPWNQTESDFVAYIKRMAFRVPHDIIALANEPRNPSWLSWWEACREAMPGEQFTVRVDGASFDSLDKVRLLDVCDVVSVNYYPQYMSAGKLQNIKAFAKNKPFWITECGFNTSDDDRQVRVMRLIKTALANLSPAVVMPWIWESPQSPPADAGYNLKSSIAPGYRPAMVA